MSGWGWPVDYWHWWILAIVLLIVEVFAPGFVALWLGVSAAAVGLVLLLWPGFAWEGQLLLFALLSVASIVAFKLYQRRNPPQTDQPVLNRRGQAYVGRSFTLAAPIVNGVGEMRVDDTVWRVEGADVPAGSRVTVVSVNGNSLTVEQTSQGADR
ncbi:MAG: NfeD family protein [Gammaproteobacteria bacterium]|nr:NfeD family protein [Gammaproteobacteria bacterium]